VQSHTTRFIDRQGNKEERPFMLLDEDEKGVDVRAI
jgi:hypothetical protein